MLRLRQRLRVRLRLRFGLWRRCSFELFLDHQELVEAIPDSADCVHEVGEEIHIVDTVLFALCILILRANAVLSRLLGLARAFGVGLAAALEARKHGLHVWVVHGLLERDHQPRQQELDALLRGDANRPQAVEPLPGLREPPLGIVDAGFVLFKRAVLAGKRGLKHLAPRVKHLREGLLGLGFSLLRLAHQLPHVLLLAPEAEEVVDHLLRGLRAADASEAVPGGLHRLDLWRQSRALHLVGLQLHLLGRLHAPLPLLLLALLCPLVVLLLLLALLPAPQLGDLLLPQRQLPVPV
mmetsp:Transcript_26138/g.62179  ORF Transcript_26138/g.62179 Transcript_26138/m.62179 type:complete len:295 (-) Transcript_26138:1076-1960(-)